MKTPRLAAVLVAYMMAASSALAVDTTQVYNSGFLVLLFVGFCALIIVAQMAPAALLLSQMISAVASIFREKKAVKAPQEK